MLSSSHLIQFLPIQSSYKLEILLLNIICHRTPTAIKMSRIFRIHAKIRTNLETNAIRDTAALILQMHRSRTSCLNRRRHFFICTTQKKIVLKYACLLDLSYFKHFFRIPHSSCVLEMNQDLQA
jgi:hypothetical protein